MLASRMPECKGGVLLILPGKIAGGMPSQSMVGELLHLTAMWACSKLASCSRTSQWHRSLAISRFEFVMVPDGLVVDTNAVVISGGGG